jgi:hypothetical protein
VIPLWWEHLDYTVSPWLDEVDFDFMMSPTWRSWSLDRNVYLFVQSVLVVMCLRIGTCILLSDNQIWLLPWVMVGRKAVYDKAVQENDKDMARSIKDAYVVRSLPTGGNSCFMSFSFSFQTSKGCSLVRPKQNSSRQCTIPRGLVAFWHAHILLRVGRPLIISRKVWLFLMS